MAKENCDLLYDIIDEACMLIYEETNVDYLDALIRVTNDILDGIDDSRLDSDKLVELENIYEKLNDYTFNCEDVRVAYNLLIIKAFKHAKLSLDMIIPDSIGLLIANIIRTYFNKESYLNMLEVQCKTANLTNTIVNFLDFDVTPFATEVNAKLATLSKLFSNMQDNDLVVYNNGLLDPIEVNVDVIIGHLESKIENGNYLPYKAISKLMRNLEEEGIFVFLIDNDFFSYPDLANFRSSFTGTLLGLLILPETMFASSITKSILIGSKKQINDFEMLVMNLPSLQDAPKLNESLIKIEDWIRDVAMVIKN